MERNNYLNNLLFENEEKPGIRTAKTLWHMLVLRISNFYLAT